MPSADPQVRNSGPWIIGGLLVLIVIVVFSLVATSQARGNANARMPDLRHKGLDWAVNEAQNAGFTNLNTHDAMGRDRSSPDDQRWKVCFQIPGPGRLKHSASIELGVVKVTESCPGNDLAVIDNATTSMPDLINRTAFVARQSLGDHASIRFLERSDPSNEITSDLGDWRICEQTPAPRQPFNGVPVTMRVVKYDARC